MSELLIRHLINEGFVAVDDLTQIEAELDAIAIIAELQEQVTDLVAALESIVVSESNAEQAERPYFVLETIAKTAKAALAKHQEEK